MTCLAIQSIGYENTVLSKLIVEIREHNNVVKMSNRERNIRQSDIETGFKQAGNLAGLTKPHWG